MNSDSPAEVHGPTALSQPRLEMIEAAGRLCQLLGWPRSMGQIYGLLYLSPKPLALDEIAGQIGISKGSASTGTRQLASWRAIRQVWVPGDRRDFFVIEEDLAGLIQRGYSDFLKPRLFSSRERLAKMSAALEVELDQGQITREDYRICSERLKKFTKLQKKLLNLAPLAERFL
jgi:HTH-type transcriptional regulator, glycine betaine synthesis regulator